MKMFPNDIPDLSNQISEWYYPNKAKTVTFIITHQCSFRCTYCYEHSKCSEDMPLEVAQKFIDQLFKMDMENSDIVNEHEAYCLILDFIGGEPLLRPKFISDVMDYFINKAISLNHRWAVHHYISISTNGWDYFDPEVQSLIKRFNGRISIGVTVDGNKELHDKCRLTVDGHPTYDRVAAAFMDIKNKFDQQGTKITISHDNLPYLFDAAHDIITNFDLVSLHGNPVFEYEWSNEDARLYYDQLKKLADWLIETNKWKTVYVSFFDDNIGRPQLPEDNQNYCGGTGAMLAVDVDGKIYPCLRYAPLSIGNELANKWYLGDVDNGITQKETINCLNCINRRSQSTDECFNCPISTGCAWCSAWNCELYGTPDKRCTNICPMHKARVLATRYYYNTIYKNENIPMRLKLHIPEEWAVPIIGKEEYDMLVSLGIPS